MYLLLHGLRSHGTLPLDAAWLQEAASALKSDRSGSQGRPGEWPGQGVCNLVSLE